MKRLLATLTLIALNSGCGETSCEVDAEDYRPRECAIKVEVQKLNGRRFSLEGINPYTGSRNWYFDSGSWYALFTKYIAVGDTVVKRKDELVFYIHKKDTVLTFPYECAGKVIQ